ncbi:MAG: hypothetical protein QOG67_619 [Verrucomicrobiota bacterium]|jgi:mono/diheme cytochrome c family protein
MPRLLFFTTVLGAWLVGCQSTQNGAPPLSAKMAARARTVRHVEFAELEQGRSLFVSRCIECHTLPAISRYTAEEWPRLIDRMAKRASLKPDQRKAILAYILTAREP